MSHLRSPPSPPPEPPEPPSVYCTPSPHSKSTTPSPRSFISRQQSSLKPSPVTKLTSSEQPSPSSLPPDFLYDRLLLRTHHHTNPVIWCIAIICLIFSLLIIFFGIAILIVFLVVKPRTPVLDTTHATLDVIYFDSPGHFNGDFTFIANFSNPNRKLDVKFEDVVMNLFFKDNLIATQSVEPFGQRRKQTGAVTVRFVSSLVALPPDHAMELQRQVISNKVLYRVEGSFRVRASFGAVHYTYGLHGRCELEMSSPPSGSLMARTCKTKR